MKQTYLVFLVVILVAACKCNNEKDPQAMRDSTFIEIPDTLLVYNVNPEKKTLQRYTEVPDSAFTAARVVNGLNQKYRNVQLQVIKQSNDTIYVTVPDSEFLSERMGSTGASHWFMDVILNLMGVPGIHYVNIDLEAGSHATPGVWGWKNFQDFTEVRDSIPAV